MILNYKIFNPEGKKTLVILHGLLGSLDNWQAFARHASAKYRVITVDQRNHGKSFHSDVFNYSAMVEDLNNLFIELKIEKAHVLGHSMGGKTVMNFALAHPTKVLSMISADMAPREYSPHHQTIFNALQALDLSTITSRNEADEILSKQIDNLGVRLFLLKNLDRIEDGFKWKMNLDVIVANYEEVIKEVEYSKPFLGNALFLGGENSDYIQSSDAMSIFEAFPNADIDYVSNAGHWLHAENPVEFSEKVLEWLNNID
jgi:esterase